MEKRHGLIIDHEQTKASGAGEYDAALPGRHRLTITAHKGQDTTTSLVPCAV
jgi:hypothetical protein